MPDLDTITTTTAATATATEVAKDPNTITLETPIPRGDKCIAAVTLRKPKAGELRGLSLTELLQMQVDALSMLLPRITQPPLLKPDMAHIDPADMVAMGSVVARFLLTKEQRADFLSE